MSKTRKDDEVLKSNARVTQLENLEDGQNRIRVQFDIRYRGAEGEKVDGDSKTVPDMTMSVQQMLDRHSRGQSVPGIKDPIFFDVAIPTLNDLTDVEEYKKSLSDRLRKTEEFLTKEKARQEEEKKAKEALKNKEKEGNEPNPSEEEKPSS